MKTGLRFLLAMFLMLAVFVLTNLLFPPVAPDPVQEPAGEVTRPPAGEPAVREEVGVDRPFEPPRDGDPERLVTVETPLFDMTFTTRGARMRSIRLPAYESFQREGPVELVPEGVEGVLGATWLYGGGADSVALDRYRYTVSPADGIRLSEGSGPRTLTFRYDYPEGQFFSEIRYTFTADSYLVEVQGELPAVERSALFVDLGPGLAINELQESEDWRAMAYLGNHTEDGTRTRPLSRVDEPEVVEGPLRWAAVKSKYFVQVILPGDGISVGDYLTAMWAEPLPVEGRASVQVASPVGDDGSYSYRAYLGPIERERLVAIGNDLEEVNPYGWRIFRPIIRPLVAVILWVVRVLHENLLLGYGWVLIVIGVLMRVLLWPLQRKAMLAQVNMMSVQPLAQEIKNKYPNDPQRMQQETMKLYKEHGVNPFAGCVPMLIPMPMLIALFLVFRTTIELRGESFMWLPDLSAADPFYILPLSLGASMFLLQFIMYKTSPAQGMANQQMKMMMYIMPVFMTVLFWRWASGLNLYYVTVNLATIPQQVLIAKERRKMQAAGPVKRSR
ncbi:MAG: membrane protein insertase YidC [Gemmatimonadota bacterium]|nr:membrane protein insertase YidC [Gemmatimonadota bacterium]